MMIPPSIVTRPFQAACGDDLISVWDSGWADPKLGRWVSCFCVYENIGGVESCRIDVSEEACREAIEAALELRRLAKNSDRRENHA